MNKIFTFLRKYSVFKKIGIFLSVILTLLLLSLIYNKIFNNVSELQNMFDTGNYSKIISIYEKKQLKGEATNKDLELVAAAYIQKANAEPVGYTESLDKAESILKGLIQKNGEYEEAHRLLGTSYLTRQDFESAKSEFIKTLDISKGNANARAGLGMVLERQGKIKQASSEFLYASKIDPKNDLANLGLARFLITEKDYYGAIEKSKAVIGSSTNIYSISEANHIIGAGYIGLNKDDQAIIYLERSLQMNPNAINTLVLMSDAYINRYSRNPINVSVNSLDKALSYLDKSLTMNSGYTYALANKYKIYILKGQYTEADQIAKKILEVLPDDKILTNDQKITYKKFFTGKVSSSVKVTSVKLIENKK